LLTGPACIAGVAVADAVPPTRCVSAAATISPIINSTPPPIAHQIQPRPADWRVATAGADGTFAVCLRLRFDGIDRNHIT